MFEAGAGGAAVDRDVLETVGNPGVHDRRIVELTAHLFRDFAAGDAVFNPELTDSRVRVGEGEVGSGFRMTEERRIEIESGVPFFRPVDPALEVFRFDAVSFDRVVGIEVDRVEVEAFFAGDEGEGLVEVVAEFLRGAGASGIVARGENSARSAAGVRFESADVVALPAVEGNRNVRKLFQRGVGIDAEGSVVVFGELVIAFNVFCHDEPLSFRISELI